MAFLQVTAFLALVCAASADVSEIVGQNQYLPPSSKGYHYDRPRIPFPAPTRPVPTTRPAPTYPQPAPSYVPPVTPTRPPAPRPSYVPPVTQRPSPRPTYIPPVSPPRPQPTPISRDRNLPEGNEHEHHHHHHEPGMPYDFEYQVKDDYFKNDYSRNEVSDGDIIRGEYRVQLPDGRLQIVRYTADWANGYNADVTYQGEPHY